MVNDEMTFDSPRAVVIGRLDTEHRVRGHAAPFGARGFVDVTIDDVGNVAAFLLSDLAAAVTSEITYVDGGFNQTALSGMTVD